MVGWIDLPMVAPLFVCSLEFGFSFAPRVKKERFFKLEDDFLLINFHTPLIGLK